MNRLRSSGAHVRRDLPSSSIRSIQGKGKSKAGQARGRRTTTSTQRDVPRAAPAVISVICGGKNLCLMAVLALFYALIYLFSSSISSSFSLLSLPIETFSTHTHSTLLFSSLHFSCIRCLMHSLYNRHNEQQTSMSVTGAFWRHGGSDPFRAGWFMPIVCCCSLVCPCPSPPLSLFGLPLFRCGWVALVRRSVTGLDEAPTITLSPLHFPFPLFLSVSLKKSDASFHMLDWPLFTYCVFFSSFFFAVSVWPRISSFWSTRLWLQTRGAERPKPRLGADDWPHDSRWVLSLSLFC